MIEIKVGRGWSAIILDAVFEASSLPEEWDFRLIRATRRGHALAVEARSVPLRLDADNTEIEMHQEILATEVAWARIARIASLYTCECCVRPGRLRIGVQRPRVFCHEHTYLVGDLHERDGQYTDPHRDNLGFPPEYGDMVVERDDIIRMWSVGRAEMRDVCDHLQLSRADVYSESIERGHGVHLIERADDEQAAEAMVRLLGGMPGRTRH